MNLNQMLEDFIKSQIVDLGSGVFGLSPMLIL